MSLFAPVENTTVQFIGGTSVNADGDIIDGNEVLIDNVSVCLAETTKTVFDPSTQTPRTVRDAKVWIPPTLNVNTDMRLKDLSTGLLYMIQGIERPPTIVNLGDGLPLVLDLKRVSSNSF